MGLFDPPYEKIRKKLPAHALPQFERVKSRADNEIPIDMKPTERALVIGFVTAAWALGEHNQHRLTLSDYDGRYISNMGTNCANMLRDRQNMAVMVVETLMEDGLIASAA